MNEMHSISWF